MANPLPQEVQLFIRNFYAASDVGPAGHKEYVNFYTPDTLLVMGPTEFEGQEGVLRFREAGWKDVATRKHTVKGTFIDAKSSPMTINAVPQVMLYGTVDYGMKDGTSKDGIEWAARMHLVKTEKGDLKLKFYQVYIVSNGVQMHD
jgi:hypothetical protein